MNGGPVLRQPRVGEAERHARLALSWLAEPGDERLAGLVAGHGAEWVLAELASGPVRDAAARHWATRLATLDTDRLLRRAAEVGARYVVPGDPDWPPALADLARLRAEGLSDHSVPLGLWVRGAGDLSGLTGRAVSVVGARAATGYGEHAATEIAGGIAEHGWATVSGAAYGIDAAAHRACMNAGWPTVAVLACGVDIDYPPGNAGLLARVSAAGLVVSELAPGTRPTPVRFLRRNRLIAALGRATIVVEAAYRSGSLSTARLARTLLRHVGAVPGPVSASASQGCLRLLREPGITLIRHAEDVLDLVGELGVDAVTEPSGPMLPTDRLDEPRRRVFAAVPKVRPAGTTSICRTAGLALPEVQSALVQLEIDGLVVREESGWRKTPPARPPTGSGRDGRGGA